LTIMATRTEDDCEGLAFLDHERVMGRLLLVWHFTAFVGDTDDQAEWDGSLPMAVRVDGPSRPEDGLLHWSDGNWLDPYWDIDVVTPDHPELDFEPRSAFMFGNSYGLDGEEEPTKFVLLPEDPVLEQLAFEGPYGVFLDYLEDHGIWSGRER